MMVQASEPLGDGVNDVFTQAAAELEILHRRRQQVSCGCLSDPQWGILLELFVAERRDKKVPTTALSQVAGVPKSTLLRMIEDLARRGLVQRDRTGPDARVTFIRPTSAARAIVTEVLYDRGQDAA